SPQGNLANLRHSRTNERIGHISRPNLWNSNSTHNKPKSNIDHGCAICSFRLSSIATHDASSQCTCPSSWTSTSSSASCPCIISCDCSPGSWCPIMLCISYIIPPIDDPLLCSSAWNAPTIDAIRTTRDYSNENAIHKFLIFVLPKIH